MDQTIKTALISVFYKTELEPLVRQLHKLGVTIYSTGGTQAFIEKLGVPCIPVETVTGFPSILGGRVKTLHPKVFGGLLARHDLAEDQQHVEEYKIPLFDLVIVDLYPFEETVASGSDEKAIIEKIDIGGPSMIRAGAKNFKDVTVIAAKEDYPTLLHLLETQNGTINYDQRKGFAAKAFEVVTRYDIAISDYFSQTTSPDSFHFSVTGKKRLRYGENPHQNASFFGPIEDLFDQLHGKELSYNNLVDVGAAVQLMFELKDPAFAIIKHTNVCGVALGSNTFEAWQKALAGDPESAFGGVLITNGSVNAAIAKEMQQLFFEVLIAPSFDEDALSLLKEKKNRILLRQIRPFHPEREFKRTLNGVLVQESDTKDIARWQEEGGRNSTDEERQNLAFANIICKHLKSNAIAIVKDKMLIGKGCGQTSRIDALRQAIAKAGQFSFSTQDAVLASDAFFPFDDSVKLAHSVGISAIIQPGGSVRDAETINYCKEQKLVLVLTGMRHFKH